VLDNKGYGTERQLHLGDHKFNEILPWHYYKVPEMLGGGRGYEIRTEGQFEDALQSALADKSQMSLLHIHLDVNDRSVTLERLTQKLRLRV
jgi:indolepyruvate decarboxylase